MYSNSLLTGVDLRLHSHHNPPLPGIVTTNVYQCRGIGIDDINGCITGVYARLTLNTFYFDIFKPLGIMYQSSHFPIFSEFEKASRKFIFLLFHGIISCIASLMIVTLCLGSMWLLLPLVFICISCLPRDVILITRFSFSYPWFFYNTKAFEHFPITKNKPLELNEFRTHFTADSGRVTDDGYCERSNFGSILSVWGLFHFYLKREKTEKEFLSF